MKKLLFAGLFFISFCVRSQDFAFPQLPAWKSDGKILSFNKDNLFEHIDGAAEFYLSFGFESLKVASWTNNGTELTIEVYDMVSPLNAWGIYSNEKSAKAQTVPVGLEGYGDATTFTFATGKFYVKMNGMQLEKVSGFSLKALAEEFAKTLCAKPEYPKVVGLFPKENQLANTCQYIPSEFMGLGFLGSAVRAKYNTGGEEITLFVVERADAASIEQIVTKYASYAESKIKKAAEGDFLFKDPFNGNVFLRWKGNYLLGATGFSDKKKVVPMMDSISKKL
ncbi:MAG TPA: DUF6599 family protein [Prolixibacteraceae bacterium]